ncbi:MAG: hypothetical protein ACP5JU_01895 [Minisyncoccia bacterium]
MKKIDEPKDNIEKFDEEPGKKEEESEIKAFFFITLVLTIVLDLYDLIPLVLIIAPGIETLMSIIVFPLELTATITFWLYSKEKAKRAKFLINLLRSSYFIELISDFIPELGRFIDVLPLRTISLILSLMIAKGEEAAEEHLKIVK